MTLEFSCPWCGSDTKVRGCDNASWRFRIPCELCWREMVVTWDGGLAVSRVADRAIDRSEDDTQRIFTEKKRAAK